MGMPVIESSGITRCESVTDIIQSVALEEAAFAHIINAEGEIIQLIVANGEASIAEIIELNSSINSMLGTIAALENVLQSKLGLFEDCLCSCDGEETTEDVETEIVEEVIVKEEVVQDVTIERTSAEV